MSGDGLLKPAEAARLFGVRSAALARWSREGRITAVYTPGRIGVIHGSSSPEFCGNARVPRSRNGSMTRSSFIARARASGRSPPSSIPGTAPYDVISNGIFR